MEVECSKYLGVYIDNNLNWKIHIDNIYNKLIKLCGIFYKIRDVLPNECIRNVYYAMVHSQVLYGIEVYANTFLSYTNKLKMISNKILRILYKKPILAPVRDLYQVCDSLPVDKLHELQLLTLVHKIINNNSSLPEIFKNYVSNINEDSQYTFRRSCDLKVVRFTSTKGQKCCVYKCVKLWNGIPNNLKIIKSNKTFKKLIKSHLGH